MLTYPTLYFSPPLGVTLCVIRKIFGARKLVSLSYRMVRCLATLLELELVTDILAHGRRTFLFNVTLC